ncbi:major facilitator superfamily domain-containing protein [Aspergillus avenaceus]|uniref:Major facilitator superfamily domain-containing protein n=1 Tax=Aspergillus avenaceus TaxID=36643 RepID=A0A5N6U3G1_ASPAV|nr:major facilitator superfamily domain-containing protein [Aspergillus avenaceus]
MASRNQAGTEIVHHDSLHNTRPEKGEELSPSSPDTEPDIVRDHGTKAWMQVLGAFFVFFNTWGVTDAYGAYQTFYVAGTLFSASSSSISWIGSTQSSILLVLGLITGPLYDMGHFRLLIYTGSFLIIVGQMMLSLCHQYYQVMLAQAVCIGLGAGLVFIPGVTILSEYFDERIELANGLAAAGSGVGGIIYPIMVHKMVVQVGFGWCVRAMGLIMLVTLLVQVVVFRDRPRPTKKSRREVIDWTAFRDPAYVVFILGGIVTSISLNIPNFYVQTYAIQYQITSGEFGFYLLSVITAGSVCGRICLNALAGKIGPFNVLFLSILICGALSFALINLHSMAGMVVIVIIYGFFSGAFISLPPPCFVKLSPRQDQVGTRMGMGYAAMVAGNLVGTPIAGAIQDHRGFHSMWIFAGVMSIGGGVIMFISRGFQGGWQLWRKV